MISTLKLTSILLLASFLSLHCDAEQGGTSLMNLMSQLNSTIRNGIDYGYQLVSDTLSPDPSQEAPKVLPLSHDPDWNRTVVEIIRSRGFEAEEHDVVTKDGYILTIQRIVNPLIEPEARARMKPVIMQHGLMSSSVDYVINSLNVRPEKWPKEKDQEQDETEAEETEVDIQQLAGDTQERPNALGFYMANRGYDVWLANSRGNIYGQQHETMSKFQPAFWSFTFDEQIAFDLPDTIQFVLQRTNKTKLGYVGHSQGTLIMFGLLSEQPEYADIVEPFVALAPVAYVDHTKTPAKYFSYLTPLVQAMDLPFAPSNFAVKYLGPLVCGPKYIKKEICANIVFLTTGFDWDELDESRAEAYLGHMPSGTSTKNIAHYGQMINSRRFAKFDNGILGNLMLYKKTKPDDYKLSTIRSKSIALFTAENDWLAAPKDVAHLLRSLSVKPFAQYNITKLVPKWNHIDFLYGIHAGQLINTRVEQVFRHFDQPTEAE